MFLGNTDQEESSLLGSFNSESVIQDSTISRIRMSLGGCLLSKQNRRWWWFLVGLNVFFLIAGQTAAVLLNKFYYDHGGNSTFLVTFLQTAGFPILFIPLILLPCSTPTAPSATSNPLRWPYVALIYLGLGILVAGDNLLYSVAQLYLSASTFSLICATQLAFTAIFAFFINSQKFTTLILNSVMVLSLSAALLAVDDHSDTSTGVTKSEYALGFACALGASAIYSLLLSLMQLTFQKAVKKETFCVVMEMQIYTSIVATIVSLIGLFASGQWKTLESEMKNFDSGTASYVMTVVWTAVSWQVCSVGVVGLIFLVTSLFSNVISTVALAIAPLAAVIVFHDKMDGVKIIAMLQAIWGFACYIYQNYIDERKLDADKANKEVHLDP